MVHHSEGFGQRGHLWEGVFTTHLLHLRILHTSYQAGGKQVKKLHSWKHLKSDQIFSMRTLRSNAVVCCRRGMQQMSHVSRPDVRRSCDQFTITILVKVGSHRMKIYENYSFFPSRPSMTTPEYWNCLIVSQLVYFIVIAHGTTKFKCRPRLNFRNIAFIFPKLKWKAANVI